MFHFHDYGRKSVNVVFVDERMLLLVCFVQISGEPSAESFFYSLDIVYVYQ